VIITQNESEVENDFSNGMPMPSPNDYDEIDEEDIENLKMIFSDYEEPIIRLALKKSHGSMNEAADLLADEYRMRIIVEDY
jgi:hypothetical protein